MISIDNDYGMWYSINMCREMLQNVTVLYTPSHTFPQGIMDLHTMV